MRDERDEIDMTNDRRIEEMFEASRQVHAQSAGSFQQTLGASRSAHGSRPRHAARRPWPAKSVFLTATAASFAGVVLVAAFWAGPGQGLRAPSPGQVSSPAPAEGRAARHDGAQKDVVARAVGGTKAASGLSGTSRPSPSVPAVIGTTPVWKGRRVAGEPAAGGVIGGVPGGVLGNAPGGGSQNSVSTSFSDTFVENLPIVGRSYQNVLAAAPGVQDSSTGGNPNVHGARERDLKAAVDGISNVDPLTGTFASNINPDAVQDIEVVTSGAAKEYGGATGGYGKTNGANVKAAPSAALQAASGSILVDEANPQANTESYGLFRENEFLATRENPLSTFSIDVDTASYANVRRFLESGSLPPAAAVRIEELINYFPYDDPPPSGEAPFATRIEIAGCPWNAGHRLARIALKAEEISRHARPASNLVFLIDVSGSMNEPAKLPLVISSLKQLVAELDGRDRIAIVVYAGASGLVLPPTPGSDRAAILGALDRLQAGGGTNGGQGLLLAYQTARMGFIPGGTNRVILATDGDFNLGVTDRGELLDTIAREGGGGIFLTALGYGMGNYKDDFLETLADKGNGNYAYIDSPREARKVLVDGMGGTLITVAKDVKIQVEFNPLRVESYRLIGYENRLLAKEDFNDDTKDAGEIGAGHSVTALYELVPAGSPEGSRSVDELRYQKKPTLSKSAASAETLTVKLRYKDPEGKKSRLLEVPAVDGGASARAASADFKFAASVAMFGMALRNSTNRGDATLEGLQGLAAEGIGRDPGGYRSDFVRLAGIASRLRAAIPADGMKQAQPVTP